MWKTWDVAGFLFWFLKRFCQAPPSLGSCGQLWFVTFDFNQLVAHINEALVKWGKHCYGTRDVFRDIIWIKELASLCFSCSQADRKYMYSHCFLENICLGHCFSAFPPQDWIVICTITKVCKLSNNKINMNNYSGPKPHQTQPLRLDVILYCPRGKTAPRAGPEFTGYRYKCFGTLRMSTLKSCHVFFLHALGGSAQLCGFFFCYDMYSTFIEDHRCG